MSPLRLLFCFIFLGVFISCSKEKEPAYLKEELLAKAPGEGPDKLEIVLAKNLADAIPCEDYGDGCLSIHRVRARELHFIAIEFASIHQAEAAAKKIYGWTTRNWLFDDVDGEPALERWVAQYWQAKSFNPVKKDGQKPETPAENVSPSPATSP